MVLGAKAPARQTVVILAIIVLFAWYIALYNRSANEPLTYSPVSSTT